MGRGERSKYWKYSFSDRKPTVFEKRLWARTFQKYRDAKESLLATPEIKGQWNEADPRALAFDVKTKEKMASAKEVLKVYLEQGWCPKPIEFSIMSEGPIPILVEGSKLKQQVRKSMEAGLRTSQNIYNRGREAVRRYGLDKTTVSSHHTCMSSFSQTAVQPTHGEEGPGTPSG
jgi:hypothetical protein